MVAQLPEGSDVSELRAIGGALLTRLAELRGRDVGVPQELWHAAERFQPLLDGVDPAPGEAEELRELALTLPRLLGAVGPTPTPAVDSLVGDRVEHAEARGA